MNGCCSLALSFEKSIFKNHVANYTQMPELSPKQTLAGDAALRTLGLEPTLDTARHSCDKRPGHLQSRPLADLDVNPVMLRLQSAMRTLASVA